VRSTVSDPHRFVVVGSGSAGRRHALALRAIHPDAPITIVRRSESTQPLQDLEGARIQLASSIQEACAHPPSFAVVASPATFHLADLEQLSQYCNHFMLEKPVAATSSEGAKLAELIDSMKLRVTVGHHLRFSDTPRAFFDSVASRNELKSLNLAYGQHLRHWRPGVPAASTVTARKDLGGGVLRELSHEIDAAWLIAGQLHTVHKSRIGRDGAPTDGLVDTSADFSLSGTDVEVDVHLDMTTDVPYRHWTALFDGVELRADLLKGTVHTKNEEGVLELLFTSTPGERDRAGISLLRAALANEGGVGCDISQGCRILNTIEAIELSADRGEPVAIRN